MSSCTACAGRTEAPRQIRQFAPRIGNQATLRRLQAKLTVGAVNDPLEKEADDAADRVMRMADPQVLRAAPPTLSRKCEECQEEESESPLQREAATGVTAGGGTAPPIVDSVLTSPGSPLDAATQQFMSRGFGADFADVRIHTDAQAAQSAAEVDARAYTVGRNVVFGAGQYDPAGESGRRLLAHELAHVVQQGSAGPTPSLQRQASAGPTPSREAESALKHAQAIQSAGNVLFDSWGNDVRDNDNDGIVDSGRTETDAYDGQHYSGTYTDFGVVAGTYTRGWPDEHGVVTGRVTVPKTQTVSGTFKYRVCADIVSQAYADAGLMRHMRSTAQIIDEFRRIGRVWHGRSTFPSEYLPGDFVATYSAGHGGHTGIVTKRSATSDTPTVIELPGPSTQADAGTYDPSSTNDIKEEAWSKQGVAGELQYLGRHTGRRRRDHH
jgi:hypothetical protein